MSYSAKVMFREARSTLKFLLLLALVACEPQRSSMSRLVMYQAWQIDDSAFRGGIWKEDESMSQSGYEQKS